ncbi:MAG: signal peptidase I [Tenericutes bacterium]|nr:signal peptidase I [Mycoplasmatota bacterium]
MKTIKKSLYLFELVILIFTILYYFVVLKSFSEFSNIINIVFWVILSLILVIKYRFPKDKNHYKASAIRTVIIGLLVYLIVIYSIGIFTGFQHFVYSRSFVNIIKNTTPVLILILSRTVIRYVISKNSVNDLKPIIILTIQFILFDILLAANYYSFHNVEQIFNFICLICLSYISREMLYSYLTYNISYVPSLILQLAFGLYAYILPFFPDLGNYVTSIFGIFLPYFLYRSIEKTQRKDNKKKKLVVQTTSRLVFLIILFILSVNVALVSGTFSHKIIAIASDSMYPTYKRGDAVIFKKIEKYGIDKIEEGDIIIFIQKDIIITHRVIKVKKNNSGSYFKTKGDNNTYEDDFNVYSKDVVGIVKYVVPVAGYPTLWMGDMFKALGENNEK